MGYVEGRNIKIEIRGAEQYDQLPVLAAELVRQKVDVIFAWGSLNAALAAKAATTTIPIVFLNGSDPVKSGIVESMNRPGGILTGGTYDNSGIVMKRLELLCKLVPGATTIGFLNNPTILTGSQNVADMEAAVRALDRQMSVLDREYRGRDQFGYGQSRRSACRCAPGRSQSDIHRQTRADRCSRRALSDSSQLLPPGVL